MQTYRICYRARINWTRLKHALPDEIDHSLNRIRQMNRRAGVTGALLLADEHMIQFLEGSTGPVLETVYCAMSDERLYDMEAIFHEPARERLFPNSLMFFRDLTGSVAASRYPQLRPLIDRPEKLTRDEGLSALHTFAGDVVQSSLTNGMLMLA
ncbi:FAD-dependent sensor of blue light [Roseibium hamelinense]|uniref:FAD-dependent sensor of blue light n=1 Tax=Roseibium hamelinense TaxID=150831 RepID=A0A562T8H6_9HYPH|nr:BLUF domain-containing protein [Roseibium hamelinense]MTI42099.1 blue light sensor protein [Roseibium hamelinense]TWI89538.1 FAD-dependent sensor of blue light [Roseibium hamelinense]